jgi:predicted nucleic acid-binding protein
MTLAAIPSGASVFVDANIFIYHFAPHPVWGKECDDLLHRVESGDVIGLTSMHVVGEAAHRLMMFEAKSVFGWSSKVVDRLQQQPGLVAQLTRFRAAVGDLLGSKIVVLAGQPQWLATAAEISQRHGLLTNDALIVAIMQGHGLANLASQDADFDRVPGLARYEAA